MNTKRHISETGIPELKPRTPMNRQKTQKALTTQKSVAVYFKDVKTEETFSSQDQKLVETTNCNDNFFRKKNYHRANPLLQRSLTQ